MRTIEEIKNEIRETEQELYRLKSEFSDIEFLGVDKIAYQSIQEKITLLQNEINNDILYIKTVYNQLLAIRSGAELLVRQNNDINAVETSEKVHKAFLMLVEYNKVLDDKITSRNSLVAECEYLVEKSANKSLIAAYRKNISSCHKKLDDLHAELRDAESQHSASAVVKNRVIRQLQEYRNQERLLDDEIQDIEKWREHKNKICDACRVKLKIKLTKKGTIMYGCPNWTSTEPEGTHGMAWCDVDENKEQAREKLNRLDVLLQIRKYLTKHPPIISLDEEEKEALQHTSIRFDEYPDIREAEYNNYLFQSLALPKGISIKDHFDELLQYSRFRIFTKLPQSHENDDKIRTVYSLALRLMNRGVVLGTSEKTEAKIKRCFGNIETQAFLSALNNYIAYKSPHNEYDSSRKKEFAEYYFPQVLGEGWATYVYTQMPVSLLIQTNDKRRFVDERVDFLVCVGDRNIVIELDGEEKHKSDAERDNVLERNGYIVKRFSNDDVDLRSDSILQSLKAVVSSPFSSALSSYGKKHLVACKIVHQVAIAIVKMLEEEHIDPVCNLNLEISSDLFSVEEQRLLLLFATEEVSELIENFAKLYGVEIDLDFFDENAKKYWIQIGDGDDNRNTIVIRDIVLPINYLCSIHHPFALVMPEKDAVTEDVLEYFLQYVYGYAQFRPGQFAAIRRTLRKEESIVLLPTGSGKSIIYQLSSMLLPGITVVISPLRALIEDQVSNLSDKGVNNVASIFSTDKKSNEEMIRKARAIMNNHSAMMLYIAPERMQMSGFREDIVALRATNNFCLVAIDEAHCVSEWGHDFRAAYLQIGRSCRRMFRKDDFVPPIIALTGTASDNVLRDVKRDLEISNTDAIITPPTFDRPELRYSIIPCESGQKFACIKELIDKDIPRKFGSSFDKFSELQGSQTASGIIFTILAARKKGSSYDAWTLFNRLNEEATGLQIGTYFSSVPPSLEGENKEETWNCVIKSYAREFKENQRQLLIATKAFGMGIDKSNIRYVIHNSLSNSIEQYYQEVGRAGRDREHSECIMLFSNSNDSWNETVLNPNLDWDKFMKEFKKASEDDRDDISPLMFFHTNNFEGTDFEKEVLFAVLNCLYEESNQFKNYKKGVSIMLDTSSVLKNYYIKKYNKGESTLKEQLIDDFSNELSKKLNLETLSKDELDSLWKIIRKEFPEKEDKGRKEIVIGWLLKKFKNKSNIFLRQFLRQAIDERTINIVAKSIIRLVTLGILEDYEYDYLNSEYKVFLGSIARDNVLEKYLIFVDGCSRGRGDDEKMNLEQIQGDNLHFIVAVIGRYVDLVYGTIEKGRRRALHSMFRLAKEAVQIHNPDKQDEYIRSEIQNYLVKDDTVDLVKSSDLYAGIYEILNAYPLYPNDVIVDSIEQEKAKKTSGYAARMLAADPYHPGLLYLRAITSIKSRNYHNADIVNDIVAAYENSERYGIPNNVSTKYLVKVMNLTFNSSCELFENLWDKLCELKEPYLTELIVEKTMELSNDDISEAFKEYMVLHIAAQCLRKMIGDE